MTFEDNFEDYMDDDGQLTPEKAFSLVTLMPKRRIKLTAYLEDKDGERIDLATVAENVTKYVNKEMKDMENNPINSQLYPLFNQYMISAVGRQVGLTQAAFLMSAEVSKTALSLFGLSSCLLTRYINQHELTVVTEETPVTEQEIKNYFEKQDQANESFRKAVFGDEETD